MLEVHFNAFNGSGHGTEIFVTDSEQYTDVEQSIMNNLGKHFVKRGGSGVKVTNWLDDLYMQVFRHQLSIIRDLLYRQQG